MARFTNIRALAFDLDGTLVDSVPGLANALDQALNTLQLPAAGAPRVATWIGNGVDVMIERALSWAQQRQPGAELLREARSLFDKYYVDTAEAGTTLFPHVAQTLEKLTAAGMPLALVTNKPTPFVAPLLRSLGIAQHFSLVIGGDDVAVKKPHPAPLFLVLGKFGLLPQELLFVGDSRNDILAAKAAGCPCVGMSFGYNYGEPVSTSEPDLVLDNFNDLMSALGR